MPTPVTSIAKYDLIVILLAMAPFACLAFHTVPFIRAYNGVFFAFSIPVHACWMAAAVALTTLDERLRLVRVSILLLRA